MKCCSMKCCSVFLAEGYPQCLDCLIECSKNKEHAQPADCPRKQLLSRELHII